MPYSIARGKGCSPAKPWAVVKDSDGTVVACHESKEGALRQIRALYMAEPALAKARTAVAKHPKHPDQKVHAGAKPKGKSKDPKAHPKQSGSVFDFTGKDAGRADEVLEGSSKEWVSSLSPEETSAIRQYTGQGYKKMNKALRAGKTTPETELVTTALNRATTTAPIIVSRGVWASTTSPAGRKLMNAQPGDVFHDAAFQSTALDKIGFPVNLQIRILVPKGSKGVYVGEGKHSMKGKREREFLMPPGGTYRVVGRSSASGFQTLDVELIAQGNPPPASIAGRLAS